MDWLHRAWGPPAADLGHCRLNLWILHGREAADAFLAGYRSLVGFAPPYHPYLHIMAAVDWLPDHAYGDRARRIESFVAAALARV